MDQLIEINSLEEYEKAIQTKSIILFTASWCPDCMFIKPFIGNVVKKYPNFTFYSINRDHFIDLCLGKETQPRCSGKDALDTLKVINAIFDSIDSKLPVDL